MEGGQGMAARQVSHNELGRFTFDSNNGFSEVAAKIKVERHIYAEVLVGDIWWVEGDRVQGVKGDEFVGQAGAEEGSLVVEGGGLT